MKKTIATLAILASSTVAFSMPQMPDPNAPKPKLRTICLNSYTARDGSIDLSSCDSSANNRNDGEKLNDNGCADGQASIRTYSKIAISSCMPTGMVQL